MGEFTFRQVSQGRKAVLERSQGRKAALERSGCEPTFGGEVLFEVRIIFS